MNRIVWLLAAGLFAGSVWPAGIAWGEEVRASEADTAAATTPPVVGRPLDGYRGIWYANQAMPGPYRYKYSGGLGTYCAKHIPLACYAAQVEKTFFVYGGMPEGGEQSSAKRTLQIMVSCYDHKTGRVPRPTFLMDKGTSDAHDNPVLMLDRVGHVWVFAAAHGTARPAYIFRSVEPYAVDAFEQVAETNFSYPQPWYFEGRGFLFLHTRYTKIGRELFSMTSEDGFQWSEPASLARIGRGHYQVSWFYKDKLATAFNYHPMEGGLNARTNLYYMESRDFGQSWRTPRGQKLDLPLSEVKNPALVHDYERDGRLVYLKDLTFDPYGNPIILYVVSGGFEPGPKNDPRVWTTARWTGREWEITGIIRSDNNYDTGCLHVEKMDFWRLIAPTDTGPQPYNPGGEMVMWTTRDQGRSWAKQPLTQNSEFNHTYARRPVNAHPGFYAFWADGNGREPSISRLYFATQEGRVYRLPREMDGPYAEPELLPMPSTGPADPSDRHQPAAPPFAPTN
jgi:hypothetical protein